MPYSAEAGSVDSWLTRQAGTSSTSELGNRSSPNQAISGRGFVLHTHMEPLPPCRPVVGGSLMETRFGTSTPPVSYGGSNQYRMKNERNESRHNSTAAGTGWNKKKARSWCAVWRLGN